MTGRFEEFINPLTAVNRNYTSAYYDVYNIFNGFIITGEKNMFLKIVENTSSQFSCGSLSEYFVLIYSSKKLPNLSAN